MRAAQTACRETDGPTSKTEPRPRSFSGAGPTSKTEPRPRSFGFEGDSGISRPFQNPLSPSSTPSHVLRTPRPLLPHSRVSHSRVSHRVTLVIRLHCCSSFWFLIQIPDSDSGICYGNVEITTISQVSVRQNQRCC